MARVIVGASGGGRKRDGERRRGIEIEIIKDIAITELCARPPARGTEHHPQAPPPRIKPRLARRAPRASYATRLSFRRTAMPSHFGNYSMIPMATLSRPSVDSSALFCARALASISRVSPSPRGMGERGSPTVGWEKELHCGLGAPTRASDSATADAWDSAAADLTDSATADLMDSATADLLDSATAGLLDFAILDGFMSQPVGCGSCRLAGRLAS